MEQEGSQNLIKAGSDLRLVPFISRGINLAEGNRGPGLYLRKYGMHAVSKYYYTKTCYYYFMKEVTHLAKAGMNGEP